MSGSAERVAELRQVFDRTFTEPPLAPAEGLVPLIAIGVAGEDLALRVDQIAGIAKRRRIAPVPSRVPALLGIAAMRGALVPVYSLAVLLGLSPLDGEPQWLALAGRESPLALAFDRFQGQVEVQPACLYQEQGAVPRRHIRQLARMGPAVRAVIDVPSLVEAIRRDAGLELTRSNP